MAPIVAAQGCETTNLHEAVLKLNIGFLNNHQSKALRKNYAGIGYTYDKELDAFIPPKCEESWTLNETTCQWECPLPYPTDGKSYYWDDAAYKADNTKGWVLESIQE